MCIHICVYMGPICLYVVGPLGDSPGIYFIYTWEASSNVGTGDEAGEADHPARTKNS